jgi:hypothetical protein
MAKATMSAAFQRDGEEVVDGGFGDLQYQQ